MERETDRLRSNGTKSKSSQRFDDWISEIRNNSTGSSKLNFNTKLNAEIHSVIIENVEQFLSTICDHFYTLYRQVSNRQIVLQFLPSFITVYYDVLHHHHHQRSHPELVDAQTKDVYSTIDTFLVSLYNLGVIDYRQNEEKNEIRIPNLTRSSIYHSPNLDHYTPVPLTANVISRHENNQDVIRPFPFAPFDSLTTLNREQMLWFLLIQYGNHVSSMDEPSLRSYVQMSIKIVSQGFPFAPRTLETSIRSNVRRIHLSSQNLTEILGTLIHIKTMWSSQSVIEAMKLVKQRAEYELFPDVLLMAEALQSLNELKNDRNDQRDQLGIEVEVPATADLIRQKRSAKTTKSIKSRVQTTRFDDSISDENNSTDTSNIAQDNESSTRRRGVLNAADNNPIRPETKYNKVNQYDINSPSTIDEPRTFIASSIGPATSNSSLSIGRNHKPNYVRDDSPSTPELPIKTRTKIPKHEKGKDFQVVALVHEENSLEKNEFHDVEETYL